MTQLFNESMSDEGVCRPAPVTPGLLNISLGFEYTMGMPLLKIQSLDIGNTTHSYELIFHPHIKQCVIIVIFLDHEYLKIFVPSKSNKYIFELFY